MLYYYICNTHTRINYIYICVCIVYYSPPFKSPRIIVTAAAVVWSLYVAMTERSVYLIFILLCIRLFYKFFQSHSSSYILEYNILSCLKYTLRRSSSYNTNYYCAFVSGIAPDVHGEYPCSAYADERFPEI